MCLFHAVCCSLNDKLGSLALRTSWTWGFTRFEGGDAGGLVGLQEAARLFPFPGGTLKECQKK